MKLHKRTKSRRTMLSGAAGLFAVCVLAAQTGWAQKTAPAAPQEKQAVPDPPAASNPSAKIAAADNRFGFRLFDEISKKDADVNVCVSPTSIALALQMAYNGASRTTKAAMSRALELNGMSMEQVNQASHALLDSLGGASASAARPPAAPISNAPDETAQLNVANSLWMRNQRVLNPDFVQRTQQFYNAQVGDLQGAPQSVNDWVSKHTNDKIHNIVSAGDVRNAVAVLVNAVYFKAVWTSPFRTEQTTDKPFHAADGNTKTCKMMSQSGFFGYHQGDAFQMVSLPYRGSSLDMIILLPKAGTKLSDFVPQITPEKWAQWTAGLASQSGTVGLPRFRAEYGVELKEALSSLGMSEAFSERADFSAMSHAKPLFISKVMHKTYINVNEQGTEAAAATSVAMMTRAMRRPTAPFQMTMDRPFLYAIRDRQTGALLFVGTLAKPE